MRRFRKRAVALYRSGKAPTLQPPLAVAISDAKGQEHVPVELANLRLDVLVETSKLQPLFMPVFILEFPRFGANFRVFVCGATGRVGGESHTSPLKAYLASATAVTATLSTLPLDLLYAPALSQHWHAQTALAQQRRVPPWCSRVVQPCLCSVGYGGSSSSM
jgi:hypothetical protein